jgi:O-antigen ligase
MAPFVTLPRFILTIASSIALAVGVIVESENSPKTALLWVLAVALLASVVWLHLPQRRPLIGLLFLTAPFDVSKAVVPPLAQFYSPGLYVTVGEGVLLLLGLVWAVKRVLVQRLPLPFTKLDRLACGFGALIWLGTLHAHAGLLIYASAVSYSICVLSFYVVSHAVQTKADLRLILKMTVVGFALQAMLVAAQLITHSFLSLPGSKIPGSGAGGAVQAQLLEALLTPSFRPIGAFDHPNALADYLTLLVPPALALVLMSRRRLPMYVWMVAAVLWVTSSVLLLLTLSRGGWAAGLVGCAFVGVVYWRKRIIGPGHLLSFAGIALVGIAVVVIASPQIVTRVTEPDQRSTESRIMLSDQALTMVKAHPLIGIGFGGYNRAAPEYTPPSFAYLSQDYKKQLLKQVVHNNYLLLAAELGLPAMLYWVYLLIRFVQQAWPLSRWRDPGMFALGVGIAGALASQILYLALDNYYSDIRIFLLWLTAGVLQALTRMPDARPPVSGLETLP